MLDLATGSALTAGSGDGLWVLSGAGLAGGLRVVTAWTRRSDDLPFTTVTDASGPVWTWGTGPTGSRRSATPPRAPWSWPPGTGLPSVWIRGRLPSLARRYGWRPVAQVAGVVVLTDVRVEVRDDRTGDVLWTAPVGEQGTALCDGTTLGLLDLDAGELVVRDLRTGAEVWRQPLPVAAPRSMVPLPGGRIAEVAGTQVVVLAP